MLHSGVEIIRDADGTSALACGGTNNEASEIFKLSTVDSIGLEFLPVLASGVVNIVVTLEVSNSDDVDTFAIEDGYPELADLQDTTRVRKTITRDQIPSFKYGRLKATGIGSNNASTTLTGTINLIREE